MWAIYNYNFTKVSNIKKKSEIKAVITARTPDYLLNNSCTDANNT